MQPEDLTKLWGRLGFVVLLFSVNSFLIALGSKPFLPFDMPDTRQAPAILFAVLLGCLILLALLRVGIAYQRQTEGKSWVNRLPVVGITELDPQSPDARAYQRVVALAFIGLPLILIVWLEVRLLGLRVIDRTVYKQTKSIEDATLGQLDPVLLLDPRQWLEAGTRYRLQEYDGVSYFPLVEPLLTVALVGWTVWRAYCWYRGLGGGAGRRRVV